MTNFEKIRSMDVESMGKVLNDFADIDYAPYCENRPECAVGGEEFGTDKPRCAECIVNWLNKEV